MGSFYHLRLNTEHTGTPLASAPPGAWHQWATNDAAFPLKVYDTNRNGGIFGGIPTDPTLATLQAGPITWGPPGLVTPTDYRPEVVRFFNLQTGSCCALGFTGMVDGLTITLKSGHGARVNQPFQQRGERCLAQWTRLRRCCWKYLRQRICVFSRRVTDSLLLVSCDS